MPKRYPQAKIDEALLAHFTLGDSYKASDESGVPARTLQRWVASTHAERYRELIERHAPRIEDELANRSLALARQATGAAGQMIDRTIQAQDPKDVSALSTAARNLSTIAGIATDKRLILTGRPTQIHQHATAEDDLRALARMFNVSLEGTAIEVPNESEASRSNGYDGTHEDCSDDALVAQSDGANAQHQLKASTA